MKAWNLIKKTVIVVGMITAISLADSAGASRKELWSALVIVALIMVFVISNQLQNEKKGEAE